MPTNRPSSVSDAYAIRPEIGVRPEDQVEITDNDTIGLEEEGTPVRTLPAKELLHKTLEEFEDSFFDPNKNAAYKRSYCKLSQLKAMRSGYRRGIEPLAHPNKHESLVPQVERFLNLAPDIGAYGPMMLAGVDVGEVRGGLQDLKSLNEQINATDLQLRRQLAMRTQIQQFLYRSIKLVHGRMKMVTSPLEIQEEMKQFNSFFSDSVEKAQDTKGKLDAATEAARLKTLEEVSDAVRTESAKPTTPGTVLDVANRAIESLKHDEGDKKSGRRNRNRT